ncbi:hypothetical protein BN1195_00032 [Chryseobacterium oranimense G311]|nr:hypothetical protein BN1195_00032 [Chryseobacterium oranimense G311]
MQFQGQILKMTSFDDQPIQYYLNLSGDLIHMNELFGRELTIKHIGFQCVNCGENKPVYRMGSAKTVFLKVLMPVIPLFVLNSPRLIWTLLSVIWK